MRVVSAGIFSPPGRSNWRKAPSPASFPPDRRTPASSITRALRGSSPVVSVSMTTASSDKSGAPPLVLSIVSPSRRMAYRKLCRGARGQGALQCRLVHARHQFIVDVAQADAEIIACGFEIPATQLLVDRHHGEIGLRQRIGDVHHAFGRMASDQIEPMRKLAARFKPGFFPDGRR